MPRKTIPLIGAMLAALAAIALAALVVWHQFTGQTAGREGRGIEAVMAPGIDMGGPFTLIDGSGRTVTLADFAGSYPLIYFGFTSCPDICPTELSTMAAAIDILAEGNQSAAEDIVPVFITIDPERDTPDVVGAYADAFHPRMVGLTGSAEAVDEAARAFRIFYSKGAVDEDGFYLMNHSGFVYLMGPDGEFLTMFNGGSDPQAMSDALASYVSAEPAS